MSNSCAELLLAAVIAARSISYLLEKVGLESIAPFTLLGIRFLIAFVFLGLVFWQKIRGASVRALRAWMGILAGTDRWIWTGRCSDYHWKPAGQSASDFRIAAEAGEI
jgi:drug/metabolite transporter (DMT)-like permease